MLGTDRHDVNAVADVVDVADEARGDLDPGAHRGPPMSRARSTRSAGTSMPGMFLFMNLAISAERSTTTPGEHLHVRMCVRAP